MGSILMNMACSLIVGIVAAILLLLDQLFGSAEKNCFCHKVSVVSLIRNKAFSVL